MTNTIFKLPDLGEGLQEVEIVTWHVSEGDFVVNEQPLVSVETEKAVVDIPSPQAGKILRMYGKAGETLAIGSTLVEFSPNHVQDSSSDAGSVVGSLNTAVTEPLAPSSPPPLASSPPYSASLLSAPFSNPHIKALPAARKLAQEKSLALETLRGTGPQGAITVRDVQNALESASASSSPTPGYEPLTGIRKSMAQHMAKSHAEVVPASLYDEANIQAWFGKQNVMTRVIQALKDACQAHPLLNSWFENNSLKQNDFINLSIAIDTPEGLLVPVMKNVHLLDAEQTQSELNRLKKAALERSLSPQDFKEGTITLSNFGAIAGQFGAMVISPPQVAILGIGRVMDKAVILPELITTHKVMPLSLTIDHRAITGGEAARFLSAIIDCLGRA